MNCFGNKKNTLTVRQNISLIRIQRHLISALQSAFSTFSVTAEFRSPLSLSAHTHTHAHNTEHKHTPAYKQTLCDAFCNSCRYHTKRKSAERRRLHSWAVAWQRDATSFWRMVMQHFRRIRIFPCFFVTPPLPLLFFTFSAPVTPPFKQNLLICRPDTVNSAMVKMILSNNNWKGRSPTKYVISISCSLQTPVHYSIRIRHPLDTESLAFLWGSTDSSWKGLKSL